MVSRLSVKPRDCSRTQEAILDAAESALREHGFKRMTIDDVAARAGLGKGTIYLYFESKDDLALSVIDRSNVRLQERLRSILKGPGPARTRLRDLIIERVLFRFDVAQGYKQGVDELLWAIRPQLQERRDKYHKAESLIFAEALIEGRTLGEFEMEDPFQIADAFITATGALIPYSICSKQLESRETVRQKVGILAELLLRAVKRAAPDHPRTKTTA